MATIGSGSLLASRYRFERFIARGGMGEVWAARDLQLDMPVALKILSPSLLASTEILVRFEREAKASAQIRSPHAVQVLGHGIENGLPFIVMELLEGEDLSRRLKRRERLPISEVAEIIRGVCKALRRAHDLGIVHRDLKPANIFHAKQDDEEIVKVLDFGIAMLTTPDAEGRVTSTGAILGTAHYMAPEQARLGARRVDHRADLWSLAVIAYRALTGQVPFPGHALEVIQNILIHDAPAPSTMVPELSPAVDAFFARALARDPNARFQSARVFSMAFQELLCTSERGRAALQSFTSEAAMPVEAESPPPRFAQTVRMSSQAREVAVAAAWRPAPPFQGLPQIAYPAEDEEGLAQTVVRVPVSPLPPPPLAPRGMVFEPPKEPVRATAAIAEANLDHQRRGRDGWFLLVVSLTLILVAGVFGVLFTREPARGSLPAHPPSEAAY